MRNRDKGRTVRPVILCGGSGSRLWPLSRTLHPKQLLSLSSQDTLLQATARRTQSSLFAAPIVVTGEAHRFLVREQLLSSGVEPEAIILEAEGRNTAGAVALAAFWQARRDADQLMLVMPSDHVIRDTDAFLASVESGIAAAVDGAIVTFGIEPSRVEIGYGYIEAARDDRRATIRRVERFVEKPDCETAARYCDSGSNYWNAGIFLFRASAMIAELKQHAAAVADACAAAIDGGLGDGDFFRPRAEFFLAAPSISIDYAVMEKTDRACVVPVKMDWSDVGSWDSLWAISDKDGEMNVLAGDVVAVDTHGSLIRSECDMTIAALGVRDLVVVATRDALLVAPRERSQDTRCLVEALSAAGIDKHFAHPLVHRPWGSYETVDRGQRFQTKRIIVKPGEKLSLQMHHQRSEHWIVVTGTAKVTIGEKVQLLQENESTYVPAGTVHRLENPGKIPLHLIEVQCGPYLGEDDIVRLEDNYGRLPDVA